MNNPDEPTGPAIPSKVDTDILTTGVGPDADEREYL